MVPGLLDSQVDTQPFLTKSPEPVDRFPRPTSPSAATQGDPTAPSFFQRAWKYIQVGGGPVAHDQEAQGSLVKHFESINRWTPGWAQRAGMETVGWWLKQFNPKEVGREQDLYNRLKQWSQDYEPSVMNPLCDFLSHFITDYFYESSLKAAPAQSNVQPHWTSAIFRDSQGAEHQLGANLKVFMQKNRPFLQEVVEANVRKAFVNIFDRLYHQEQDEGRRTKFGYLFFLRLITSCGNFLEGLNRGRETLGVNAEVKEMFDHFGIKFDPYWSVDRQRSQIRQDLFDDLGKAMLRLGFPGGANELIFTDYLPLKQYLWEKLETVILPNILFDLYQQLANPLTIKQVLIAGIKTALADQPEIVSEAGVVEGLLAYKFADQANLETLMQVFRELAEATVALGGRLSANWDPFKESLQRKHQGLLPENRLKRAIRLFEASVGDEMMGYLLKVKKAIPASLTRRLQGLDSDFDYDHFLLEIVEKERAGPRVRWEINQVNGPEYVPGLIEKYKDLPFSPYELREIMRRVSDCIKGIEYPINVMSVKLVALQRLQVELGEIEEVTELVGVIYRTLVSHDDPGMEPEVKLQDVLTEEYVDKLGPRQIGEIVAAMHRVIPGPVPKRVELSFQEKSRLDTAFEKLLTEGVQALDPSLARFLSAIPGIMESLAEVSGSIVAKWLEQRSIIDLVNCCVEPLIPALHPGRMELRLGDKVFIPETTIHRPTEDGCVVEEVIEQYQFQFPDPKNPSVQREMGEIEERVDRELRDLVKTLIKTKVHEATVGAWKEACRRVKESTDEFVEKYFGEESLKVKAVFDRVLYFVFVTVIGTMLYYLTWPVWLASQLVVNQIATREGHRMERLADDPANGVMVQRALLDVVEVIYGQKVLSSAS